MSIRSTFRKVSVFRLAPREVEIAKRLAQRETVAQIAERLNTTPNTISASIVRANRKLGLFNRFQLAVFAMENLVGANGGEQNALKPD